MNERKRGNRPNQPVTPTEHFALNEEPAPELDANSAQANSAWASRLGADYAIAANGSESRESWAGF